MAIYNTITGEKMNLSQTVAAVKAQGLTCKWLPDTQEFRVNVRLGTEATAYYTQDPADAIGTARAMAQANANAGTH